MKNLDKEDELERFEFIQNKINSEGFHYCFKSYSSFEDVEDNKFHELRLSYLKSAKELKEHIEQKINNLRDY